jgi:hypothetical protein
MGYKLIAPLLELNLWENVKKSFTIRKGCTKTFLGDISTVRGGGSTPFPEKNVFY